MATLATVYNKPGVGVRKMEATRWLAALFILIIMYAGIYFYTKSVKAIATLGLPVALVVFVGIIYWIKAMGNKAEASPIGPSTLAVELWQKRLSAICWANSRQNFSS